MIASWRAVKAPRAMPLTLQYTCHFPGELLTTTCRCGCVSGMTVETANSHDILDAATRKVSLVDRDEHAGTILVISSQRVEVLGEGTVEDPRQVGVLALLVVVEGLERELRRGWIE
jgi:hypothetical protein